MKKGNLGEWAETYTLLKLLTCDHIYTLDGSEVKLSSFHKSFNGEVISLENKGSGFSQGNVSINKSDIESALTVFKNSVKPIRGTFAAPSLENALKSLGIYEIKAPRSSKADIALSFFNAAGISDGVNDYSIKSELKGLSTILNASGHTNFKYRIDAPFETVSYLNNVNVKSKVKEKFKQLQLNNFAVNYHSMLSDDFRRNIEVVSVDAVTIFSKLLLAYFQGVGVKISDLVANVFVKESERVAAEKVVKKVLVEFLLHSSPGDSEVEKERNLGGLIVLDGSYNIGVVLAGDRVGLAEYLYTKAILDTPSTSRHKFGKIYCEDEVSYINLNLQVRLKP